MIILRCVKDVIGDSQELFFKKERIYKVEEISSDKVYVIDEFGNNHIVADSEGLFFAHDIHSFLYHDEWFKKHFEYLEEV